MGLLGDYLIQPAIERRKLALQEQLREQEVAKQAEANRGILQAQSDINWAAAQRERGQQEQDISDAVRNLPGDSANSLSQEDAARIGLPTGAPITPAPFTEGHNTFALAKANPFLEAANQSRQALGASGGMTDLGRLTTTANIAGQNAQLARNNYATQLAQMLNPATRALAENTSFQAGTEQGLNDILGSKTIRDYIPEDVTARVNADMAAAKAAEMGSRVEKGINYGRLGYGPELGSSAAQSQINQNNANAAQGQNLATMYGRYGGLGGPEAEAGQKYGDTLMNTVRPSSAIDLANLHVQQTRGGLLSQIGDQQRQAEFLKNLTTARPGSVNSRLFEMLNTVQAGLPLDARKLAGYNMLFNNPTQQGNAGNFDPSAINWGALSLGPKPAPKVDLKVQDPANLNIQ